MNRYNKYAIKETDGFDPGYFQKVEDEINDMIKMVSGNPGLFTELIILSYLKSRSINSEWVDANPVLSGFMTDGGCTTTHMEALFESGRGNPRFTSEFEDYIRMRIAEIPVTSTGS